LTVIRGRKTRLLERADPARYVDGGPDAGPAVVVVDAWQGQGIGTVLVGLAVARWKAASVETLHVEILAGNTASNRLMRSLSGNRAAPARQGESCITGFRSPGRSDDGFG
jgi:GNAT superfamily N-acetyltransferase